MPYLEKLGFHLVGYGCTTCIGNSGPLLEEIEKAITENDMLVASCCPVTETLKAGSIRWLRRTILPHRHLSSLMHWQVQ